MREISELAAQPIAADVLLQKYAAPGETGAAQVRRRVAAALAAAEPPAQREPIAARFEAVMAAGFIPGGRIQHGAGRALQATLMSCFVQPVGDAVLGSDDGRPGIYAALGEAAETLRQGGGVGYNFSHLRPRGAPARRMGTRASGPVSYMHLFDRSCETLSATRQRRCAQMAVLNIDHPDILEFIAAKQERGALRNFNLSVAVEDAFMAAVENDAEVELVHGAEPGPEQIAAGAYRRADGRWCYRRLRARVLWETLMRCAYAAAEPGVLFTDHINRDNNLAYCETLEATNPCGEQPLPDYGCCCLGSFDLTRFVRAPFSAGAAFDTAAFAAAVPDAVRLLDNVLTLTAWPLPLQREEGLSKRRIGLGITGLGDALILLGLRYDSEAARAVAAGIGGTLRDSAYAASVALARERGPFPRFDAERYLQSGFARRLPPALCEDIRRHGLRNSHLTAIAPAGSISLAFADNVSAGIEPAFAWRYHRTRRRDDGSLQDYRVEDRAHRLYAATGGDIAHLPPAFAGAWDIAPADHLAMMAALAPYIDAGIAKTVNVPEEYPFAAFKGLYREAWRAGLKGVTAYRPNAVSGVVLSAPERPAAFCSAR